LAFELIDNKDQALYQAMPTIREEYTDSVAWAFFTLIGETESTGEFYRRRQSR